MSMNRELGRIGTTGNSNTGEEFDRRAKSPDIMSFPYPVQGVRESTQNLSLLPKEDLRDNETIRELQKIDDEPEPDTLDIVFNRPVL